MSVVLPMPRALYEEDFTPESRDQFAQLCNMAQVDLLPIKAERFPLVTYKRCRTWFWKKIQSPTYDISGTFI